MSILNKTQEEIKSDILNNPLNPTATPTELQDQLSTSLSNLILEFDTNLSNSLNSDVLLKTDILPEDEVELDRIANIFNIPLRNSLVFGSSTAEENILSNQNDYINLSFQTESTNGIKIYYNQNISEDDNEDLIVLDINYSEDVSNFIVNRIDNNNIVLNNGTRIVFSTEIEGLSYNFLLDLTANYYSQFSLDESLSDYQNRIINFINNNKNLTEEKRIKLFISNNYNNILESNIIIIKDRTFYSVYDVILKTNSLINLDFYKELDLILQNNFEFNINLIIPSILSLSFDLEISTDSQNTINEDELKNFIVNEINNQSVDINLNLFNLIRNSISIYNIENPSNQLFTNSFFIRNLLLDNKIIDVRENILISEEEKLELSLENINITFNSL